jgi:hypothetical protein
MFVSVVCTNWLLLVSEFPPRLHRQSSGMESIVRKVEELNGIHDWYFCEDRTEKQVKEISTLVCHFISSDNDPEFDY